MKKDSLFVEIGIFVGITYILSWLLWMPALLKVYGVDLLMQEEVLIKIGNFMPSILGIVFIAFNSSREGVLKLFKQLIKVKFSVGWYLFSLLLMPFILVSAYFLGFVIMDLEFNSILWPILSSNIGQLIPMIIYFIVFQGPLGEELGWRGYVLPKLLEQYNLFKASVIIGIIWMIWHLPKFFLTNSTQYSLTAAYGISMALIGYLLYTIMLSVLITFLYCRTGKSLFAVVLFHAMANFSHGLITILTEVSGSVSLLLMMLVATSIVLYAFYSKRA